MIQLPPPTSCYHCSGAQPLAACEHRDGSISPSLAAVPTWASPAVTPQAGLMAGGGKKPPGWMMLLEEIVL